VANTLNSFRGGVVGFIDWLDELGLLSRIVLLKNLHLVEYDDVMDFPPVICAAAWMWFLGRRPLRNKGDFYLSTVPLHFNFVVPQVTVNWMTFLVLGALLALERRCGELNRFGFAAGEMNRLCAKRNDRQQNNREERSDHAWRSRLTRSRRMNV
jgi:hypothetical protein